MYKGPGVIHYNFPDFTQERFFSFCREHGIGYVEIPSDEVIVAGEDTAKNIARVARLLQESGIKVSQVTARNDFLQPTKEAWDAQIQRIVEAGQIARALGANLLRIDGGWEKPGVEKKDYDRLITDGLKAALDATEPLHPCTDGLDQGSAGIGFLRRVQRSPQDAARFFFHRTPMLRRPHTQARLHVVIEIADGHGGHGMPSCLTAMIAL